MVSAIVNTLLHYFSIIAEGDHFLSILRKVGCLWEDCNQKFNLDKLDSGCSIYLIFMLFLLHH
jgi:hypothetical protein